jgi:hypothetical protein
MNIFFKYNKMLFLLNTKNIILLLVPTLSQIYEKSLKRIYECENIKFI